jgi:hypothetical protein
MLSSFFTWALKKGIAGSDANPVEHTNDPSPGENPRDRVLKPEEIAAIWQTLPDTEYGKIIRLMCSPRRAAAKRLAAWSGRRSTSLRRC